jgi:cytochrome P450
VQLCAMKSARMEFDPAALVQPPPPILAGPRPPEKSLPFPRLLRVMKDNPLAAIPRIAYEQLIWDAKWLFGHKLLVSDPVGIKRVLLDNAANYPKAPLDVHILSKAFGEGIHVSDGEKWRTHRRMMSSSFDVRSIASYAPPMVEAAQVRLRAWDLLGEGGTVDIAAEMRALTREVISRTMFSADASALGSELSRALHEGFEHLNFSLFDIAPLIGPILLKRKLRRARSELEPLYIAIDKLIEARRGSTVGQAGDLLDRLLAAADSETGAQMTDEEVRDEVIVIFLGGHETSALATTYVWYLLSQHAFAEERLHMELASVLGGRAPTVADLQNLPYTRMVIEESLRLYPPGPMLSGRVAREADVICGHPVPKGMEIAVLPWVVHRHRMLWDNPDLFDPDRFSPERSAGRSRFAYLPFGGGHRVCIGAALAMTEISLLLATMAQRYRLRLVPGQDIVLRHRLTLRPRDGIRMSLERRIRPGTL